MPVWLRERVTENLKKPMLVICLLLAILPLLGVAWIFSQSLAITVDNLFMSLILLAISASFGINVLIELRNRKLSLGKSGPAASSSASRSHSFSATNGTVLDKGRVESVQFFESHVGQRNTSIVTLSDDGTPSRLMAFEGDLRNALPVGKSVEITMRDNAGRKILLNVNYR